MGCTRYPLFVVSESLLAAIRQVEPTVVTGSVRFLEGAPDRSYRWLIGSEMIGAKFNWRASGYESNPLCPACGKLDGTPRLRGPSVPDVFVDGSETGAKLFTTDLNPRRFYCTIEIVDILAAFGVRNIAVRPVARNGSSFRVSRALDIVAGER